jgi:LPS-assembly protein
MSDVQGLRETDTPDKETTILPSVFYAKTAKGPLKDQIVRQELSALQLDNDEGYEIVRWTALLGTERKFDLGSQILTTSGDILASYHDVQKSALATDKLSTFGQGNMILSGEWKYPIGVQYGGDLENSAIITPRLKATLIEGSDRTDELPNRDAADFRLDEANLFLNNRFQGRDFILPGTHVAGGISGITNHSVFGDITGFAGLSYKVQGKTPAGLTISEREDFSDYVASLSVNTPFNLNVSWSGRADYDQLKLNESRTSLDYSTGMMSANLEHTQIAQGFFEADKEEAQIRLAYKLPNDIQLVAEQVWDLSSGKTKREQSVLSAQWSGGSQNCVTLSLDYKRDPFVDRDIKKVSELQLNLSFKYLGSINSNEIE